MAQVPPYVPNDRLTVAANLRYNDSNGDTVSKLYPNDYTELIGGNLSSLKATYQQVSAILANYGPRITEVEVELDALQTSGVNFMLYVSPGCLYNDNVLHPINDAFNVLTTSYCSYTTVLGTPTALAVAIAAETAATLNALPAYSQSSAMSGLANWNSTPTTVASSLQNMWLAYLDMRVGVTQSLSQSNITCANVHITYQGVYNMANRTITFYFYSSSIPTNFSGSGSNSGTVLITDTAGNTFTQTFNIYTQVATGYLTCDISLSALAQNSKYTVVLSYALTSTTPSLGCNGGIPGTVINNQSTCPNTTAVALSSSIIQFTFTPTLIDNVVYDIDLLSSSGTTSGTTVIYTKTYVNPVAAVTDTFSNLTSNTHYWIRTSVISGTNTTVCPLVSQSTSG